MPPSAAIDTRRLPLTAVEPPYDGMAPAIVLGMPQLCQGGLSETWLLKDIGHRHWTMLAAALGQSLPEFEDAQGAAVHAAFNAVAVRQGRPPPRPRERGPACGERPHQPCPTRSSARSIALSTEGRMVAEVEVISTFVKRMVPGVNRSAAAATPLGLPPLVRRTPMTGFAAEASALRAERWETHFGFRRSDGQPPVRHRDRPLSQPGLQRRRFPLLRDVPVFRRSCRMGILPHY